MSRQLPLPFLLLAAAAGLGAACGDAGGPAPDPSGIVESVEVAGPTLDLAPGDQLQLAARALDAAGHVVPGRTFSWRSDAVAVATVTATGRVTAIGAGEVTIYATTGAVSGGLYLVVLDDEEPPVAWIDLAPSGEVELRAGETLQLIATAYGPGGDVLVGRDLGWESSAPEVATVSASGLVTGVSVGTAAIAVTSEGQRDEMVIRVPASVDHLTLDATALTLGVGEAQQLVAQPRDALGQPLARPVTWASSDPARVAVDAAGVVTALAPGAADVTAASEGQRASARVEVSLVTHHSLVAIDGDALPAILGSFTATLPDGGTQTRSVRLYDGWLAIDHGRQTYEAVLHGIYVLPGQLFSVPLPIIYESTGTVTSDPDPGALTFTPDTGPAFTGRWLATDLELRWQPDGRMASEPTLRLAAT